MKKVKGCTVLRLNYPLSQKEKKQLSQMEVDTSRQLSFVRIHVEQVIGVLRQKYTILEGTIPINMLMTLRMVIVQLTKL